MTTNHSIRRILATAALITATSLPASAEAKFNLEPGASSASAPAQTQPVPPPPRPQPTPAFSGPTPVSVPPGPSSYSAAARSSLPCRVDRDVGRARCKTAPMTLLERDRSLAELAAMFDEVRAAARGGSSSLPVRPASAKRPC